MDPSWFGGNRQTVAIIGFLATWWTGLIAGVVLGPTSLILPNHKTMASTLRRALALSYDLERIGCRSNTTPAISLIPQVQANDYLLFADSSKP